MSGYKKEKEVKTLSISEAKSRICYFCAYQERSQKQVREKLYEYRLFSDEVEELIAYLIEEKYINEQRFAEIFAGGKFRHKQWGRRKILMGLRQHNISEPCIALGMAAISEEDYIDTIYDLIEKKTRVVKTKDSLKRNQKIATYIIGKGFETSLVWECIKKNCE